MTVVQNPLEPGVYRIDLPCPLAPAFGNWRRAQRGKVHVLELENGPNGTARVSFVVFARPGAFPFGRLGKPVAGQVVGELPGWAEVVTFVLNPLGAAEQALGHQMAAFLAAHTTAEFAALHEAVTVVRANMAVIRAELVAVQHGAPNGPAVLHHAAQLTAESIELLVQRAGAIPGAFPRIVLNEALAKLNELADAIAAAPGKALHAITSFGGEALEAFALPALLEIGGIVAAGVGALMAWSEGKVSPVARNLLIGGAAAAFASGFVGAGNLDHLLHRTPTK